MEMCAAFSVSFQSATVQVQLQPWPCAGCGREEEAAWAFVARVFCGILGDAIPLAIPLFWAALPSNLSGMLLGSQQERACLMKGGRSQLGHGPPKGKAHSKLRNTALDRVVRLVLKETGERFWA